MTLVRVPLMTNGADHSAQSFRLMLRDLARGNEGVTERDDFAVTQLTTPGGAVQVADGSCLIRGRANAWQGHYTAFNIGAATVSIAPTGATPRNDLVIVRVLDPEYEGSLDPATDSIVFLDVVSDVASNTTAPPAGYTAIPLARIVIPAYTSTITASMIYDMRRIANPRRERRLFTASPSSLTNYSTADGTYRDLAAASWSVSVPSWATAARVKMDISGLRYQSGAAFGAVRWVLGSSMTGQSTNFDDNQSTVRRDTVVAADTLSMLSAYQGTAQTLKAQMALFSGNATPVGVDSATMFVADVEFSEETIGQFSVRTS